MNPSHFADVEKMMAGIRKEYHFGKLDRPDLDPDPFKQFYRWLKEAALKHGDAKANVMVLATEGKGRVSARCVLLKGFSSEGLVFYSHSESLKARQMRENPKVCACFYWPEIERQVSVSGRIKRLPKNEAEIYFHSRPREAQIAAWCTKQSRPAADRKMLDERFQKFSKKFEGKEIPISPFWAGFRIVPFEFEFWQGRANRLNDRFQYRRKAGRWRIVRLQP